MGFSFHRLGHAPGAGLWGAGGTKEVKKFKHGRLAYQIDGDDEQNRMQVKFSSQDQTGVKRSNIIKISVTMSISNTKLCACSHK